MCRDTGARARSLRLISRLLILNSLINTVCSDYGVPIEIQLWDTGKSPLDHMVDVTNEFGLKVLANHNFLNDNNIAFSPYGLTGIMVALYEGVDGESSYQIQRGMQMPWNRNVMRIGFRDIHRTLKTYFVPEEGFLAGLALNNENVTFNTNYKKILRFYGFDLEKDQRPNMPPPSTTVGTTTTSDVPSTTTSMPETPTREETTPNPSAETLANVDVRIPSTTSSSSAANADIGTPGDSTTAAPSTPQGTTVTETMTPIEVTATESVADTTPDSQSTTSADVTTILQTTEAKPFTNSEISTVAESTATETAATTSNTETSTVASTAESVMTSLTTDVPTTIQEMITTSGPPPTANETTTTTLETLSRKKKSIVDFIFTSPPYVDDYLIYRSYNIPAVTPQPTFDGSNNMFLVNGLKSIQVTYMQYDTILEHAYLPHLEASALRLPLDSERYYLLVVLPTHAGPAELGRLIARMARESDLRDVHGALRPRRVRAIVPSFTVKGHVILTTDLQKLGIQDVFEPRQRDFTPMTSQVNVYVRSIEQAVSVAIRKYRPDDNQKRNRYVANRQPVQFSATYPFVYFVMDASIHVSLMAGKMVDPLNTRIL